MARQTRCPPELREEAIALVNSSEGLIAEVATSLGLLGRTI